MRIDFLPRLQMTFAAVSAGVGVAGVGVSLYKTISAAEQEKKEKAAENALKHPFYKIQDEYIQNQNAARVLATGGIPIDTKTYLESRKQQQLSTTLSAIKQGGGSPNEYGKATQLFDEGFKSIAGEDALQHIENIKYLMGVNKDVAGQKTTQWGINELQPYENQLKQITQRRAADIQNEWSGISDTIGSLGALSTSLGKLYSANPSPDNDIPDYADIGSRADIDTGAIKSPANNYQTLSAQPSQLL